MVEALSIEDRRTKILFVAAIVLAFSLSLASQPDSILMLMGALGGDSYPLYGNMVWDFDRNECSYYDTTEPLPRGYDEMFNSTGEECWDTLEAMMLKRRLEFINQSTDSEEVKEVVERSYTEIERFNYSEAHKIADSIEVERSYSIEENSSE